MQNYNIQMKKFKIITLILIFILSAKNILLAQNKTCGTLEHTRFKGEADSTYTKNLKEANELLEKHILNRKIQPTSKTSNTNILKIPVVVHVLYKTDQQNISDAQIRSQLKVMNEDFRKLNPDTVKIPDVWKNLAADTHIEFCLATKDPAGNTTNGIIRRPTKINSFTTDDKVKYTIQGGDDAWDTKKYLNIWVCNLTGGLLGYGEFPTNSYSNTYGFVVAYYAFGTEGNVNSNTKRGRTTIHEISHCFNLRHIWADDGGGCSIDDGIDDTPKQAGPSSGCPKFPYKDACQIDSPGIMFMNYMDYSNDACMNMFTEGQALRMRSAIELFYPTLNNPLLCDTVILSGTNAMLKAINNPVGEICSDSVMPQIVVSNIGLDTILNLTIKWRLDNGNWNDIKWIGKITALEDKIIYLTPIKNLINDKHRLDIMLAEVNGLVLQAESNDSAFTLFDVKLTRENLPYAQSFESTPFPGTTNIKILNSGGVAWQKTTKSSVNGLASIFIDNKLNDHEGDIDAFLLPNIDLTTFEGTPYIKFMWAYARKDNSASDALQVLLSLDCGYSFVSLFNRAGNNLETSANNAADFTPIKSEWKEAVINLNNYKNNNNVVIAFQNIAGGNGNNLYIDNISIGDRFTNVNEVLNNENLIRLYPNPTESVINIDYGNTKQTDYEIIDTNGKLLMTGVLNPNQNQINAESLRKGLYLIIFKDNNKIFTQKFIKQ